MYAKGNTSWKGGTTQRPLDIKEVRKRDYASPSEWKADVKE